MISRLWAPGIVVSVVCFGQVPTEADQIRALEDTRNKAISYSKSLPDFLCTEVVHRYEARGPVTPFHSTDTLTVQVSYFQMRENYQLMTRNNRPTKQRLESVGGAFSQGEFGSKLLLIFHPASKAKFSFQKWDAVGDRRAAVYSYRVDRVDSHFELRTTVQSTVAGYHGLVYIDDATHMVLRIEEEVDVPQAFPVQFARNTGDYGFVDVGGHEYLLPSRFESISADLPMAVSRRGAMNATPQLSQQVRFRNVIEFRDYRKYGADSTLTFDAPEESAKPKPGPPKE